jgi:hypothetical protein
MVAADTALTLANQRYEQIVQQQKAMLLLCAGDQHHDW